jgi:hypothetical protein
MARVRVIGLLYCKKHQIILTQMLRCRDGNKCKKKMSNSPITRVVNIAAMNDEIVIGNEIFCSSDYRAIGFKMSIDR